MAAAAGPTTSIHNLTNDLLELVLLGLDSPLYLVRAASSCKRWRLIVGGTDGAFLRRFRSLHPPAVIGTYYSINQHDNPPSYGYSHNWPEVDPVFVPSSAYASDGLQLSLDFVPPPADGPRELVDGRGSLLLLLREKERPERRSCMCCIHYADYMTPDLDNDGGVYLPRLEEVHLAGRTGGRIYWSCEDKQIMVLDESTLRFSTLVISEHMKNWEEFGRNNLRIGN
nr:unnamed protein product [Digitaria exilis]